MTLDRSQKAGNHSISWFFAIVLLIIGILNLIHIHFLIGAIYIVIALSYLPSTNTLLNLFMWFWQKP